MTKNMLEERDDRLAVVDYSTLLKEILTILSRQPTIFHSSTDHLSIDVHKVTEAVVAQLANRPAQNILPFAHTKGTLFATAHFANSEAIAVFAKYIEEIKTQLQKHLDASLEGKDSISYVTDLLTPVDSLKRRELRGLDYPFDPHKQLQKRRLHISPGGIGKGNNSLRLRGHKVMITVKRINDFDLDMIEGVCNRLRNQQEIEEKEIERARDILSRKRSDSSSELSKIRHIASRESLGRLQKEARIRYLEYLERSVREGQDKESDSKEGLLYLRNLAKRLRLLEAFINDETKSDGDYQVSYAGFGANYREIFSRADAYNVLPIITEIEGTLGETFNSEKGEQAFTFGIKLKLNGPFQMYSSAFNYYLTLLNPASQEHRERIASSSFNNQRFAEKVLKIALLYYFVFKKMDNVDYNPVDDVENELLSALRADDSKPDNKEQKLQWLHKGLSREEYVTGLEKLKTMLEKEIKKSKVGSETASYPLHLSISEGIVDPDSVRMFDELLFFQADVSQEKSLSALKYLAIQDADAGGNALCTLPVTIEFRPMYFTAPDEPVRQFSMQYDLQNFDALPVFFIPDEEHARTWSEQYYAAYKRIIFSYQHQLSFKYDSPEAFLHRFVYQLLCYICLKLLLDPIRQYLVEHRRWLFVPIVRLHLKQKNDQDTEDLSNEESIIRSYSKLLAHILGDRYSANAQGFNLRALQDPGKARFYLSSGLSSLYSALPKAFTLDTPSQIDKVAMIVVSSRKSDAHYDSARSLSNVYGEVIGFQKYPKGPIQIRTLATFAANESSHRLYHRPSVILEEAKKWYERGYRHILYVAKAPYSSSVHLANADEEEQFFMSQHIIQSLTEQKDDVHVYPIYCDKYYVVKMGTNPQVESLYVDDTSELRTLAVDPNHSAVVFFNLLNGITVGTGGKVSRYYNGVVSYATLLNVYDDPIFDQTIRNNLLDANQPGSLKRELLDYITLLHFSRYEKEKNISFKLDPYESIVGPDSVGALSSYPHMIGSVRFNALAFLTEVRSVLDKQYTGFSAQLQATDTQEQP